MSRSFDKIDDYIQISSSGTLNDVSPLTLAWWMNPISTGEGGIGTVYDCTGLLFNKGFTTYFQTLGGFEFDVNYVGGGLLRRLAASNTVVFNKWQHFAITWDGSVTSTNVHMYLNAVEVTYQLPAQDGSGSVASDALVNKFIGNVQDTSGTFDGKIAHLHVYQRVLSVNELQQIMWRPGTIRGALKAYWPLWGSPVEGDYSPNQNNGTVSGALTSSDNPPINGMAVVGGVLGF